MEILDAGNVDLVDELLAPDYMNTEMGGMGLAAFKAMLPAMAAAIPVRHMELHDLIAEGDAVVARFTYEMTLASGEKVSARGLTYYRLASGKIVEDDPLTSPDLAQVLGPLMQAPAGR
jgi:predicted ester cyclase